MKIYEYTLLPNETASFYDLNGYITHINDKLHPYVYEASEFWEPNNGYTYVADKQPTITECTLTKIKKKDFVAYAKERVQLLLVITAVSKNNIIVARRNINEEEMECCWFHCKSITNNELQENLMEAFW